MAEFSAYGLVIVASIIIILSYLFGLVAKKFNVPSVLLLILLGMGIKGIMDSTGLVTVNLMPYLEVLGIVGLIMIVLEAALDLELKREKLTVITKSFAIAAIGLLASTAVAAFIIHFVLPSFTILQAILYAVPLSVLSSSIIIPSVVHLRPDKREFHVYESTFSDILGIMLFYFLTGMAEPGSSDTTSAVGGFFVSVVITVVLAFISSYGLIFIFQSIKSKVKLFLLIAILILIYSVGKQMHLSSLLIILVFGMLISNAELFFPGFLKRTLKAGEVNEILEDLHMVTAETAFVVRTFFFVIFGMSIALSSLFSVKVVLISVMIVASIYVIRIVLFKLFYNKDVFPQIYIAPRGLITVLLFFGIPKELQVDDFDPGILLFIIMATSIVMSWALIRSTHKKLDDEVLEMLAKDGDSAAFPVTGSMRIEETGNQGQLSQKPTGEEQQP